jgi:CTP:molybdopterin cytidylyltransferase MocA
MGAPKALLPLAGATFLETLLGSMRAAGAAPLFVVVRASDDGPPMRAACARHDARLLVNPDPDRGMISSIHVGLAEIARLEAASPGGPRLDALFVAPVDCPRVRAATIARLVEAFAATRAPIVVPRFGDRRGHPTLFARALFPELRAAPPDVGARAAGRAPAADRLEVPVDDPAVLEDFDRPPGGQAGADPGAP